MEERMSRGTNLKCNMIYRHNYCTFKTLTTSAATVSSIGELFSNKLERIFKNLQIMAIKANTHLKKHNCCCNIVNIKSFNYYTFPVSVFKNILEKEQKTVLINCPSFKRG